MLSSWSSCSFPAFISEVDTISHLSSTFDPLGSFSRTTHVGTKQQRKWSKNFRFHYHKKSESLRGIFTKTKTNKSPVAFSLNWSRPWPKRWPPIIELLSVRALPSKPGRRRSHWFAPLRSTIELIRALSWLRRGVPIVVIHCWWFGVATIKE